VTDNQLVVVFAVVDGTAVRLEDEIEVDLVNVVGTKQVFRPRDERTIQVQLRHHDIHDLRSKVYGRHGKSSNVSKQRLLEP
jgi:hypothetical protein